MILAHDVAGSGPLLVLVHGITEDRRSWDPIDLTDSFTVLRVDVRGHGESEAAEPYDIPTLAADVHDTVLHVCAARSLSEDGLPEGRPVVVGHSMGGIVATAYGALFPARAVVNVDQPLHLAAMQQQVLQADGMLRGEQFPLFIEGMFAQMSGALDASEKARLDKIRAPKQDVVLGVWRILLEGSPEEVSQLVGELTKVPADVPYLVITGLDAGPEYAQWLQQAIPHAVQEVWQPPTHYPHLADPARFVARVESFVR
ncbi:Pimeloyl-ACP methyl ester carboxylesterase [Quadrisphaera granulorum]|uniref:Pimeloyl-ACP methyl ester carboxylesterase n=1 Tax=Quadrisphaera granulorum TaxID=317664 RepID=A0A315ZS59_9ACTN|nr:alpha/beta hydrolase [Quadrisphaera granulorum]PWJ48129.1 pimeloyl-ACP methyl ester carboxylesterase [Quadrisphaera granulorum]SZE98498.1 Pimeloyl-ACP methyl ester carboxylesterase [Quadrisphaera granulorum]